MVTRPTPIPSGIDNTTCLRGPRALTALLLSLLLAGAAVIAGQPPPAKQVPQSLTGKQLKSLGKLAEPWPDAAAMAARRADAEHRALFQRDEPLKVSLSADFKAINRDRDMASTKVFPGVLTVTGTNGPAHLAVELRPRGNLRRRAITCANVPLRVEFIKGHAADLKGTPFEGQKALKLVVTCQNDRAYEQFVLREYLAYRVFNLITPRSFRARLVTLTTVDAATTKTQPARPGYFIEDDDDVARRMDGRVADLPRTMFRDHELDTATRLGIFEFLVGNTDFSVFALHNVLLVKTPANILFPVPFDFDVSGLVNPPYAAADRRLGLQTVRERLYRGPCRTADDMDRLLEEFRAKRGDIVALTQSVPDLERTTREDLRTYVEDFFSIINDKGRVRRRLVDTCSKGMI